MTRDELFADLRVAAPCPVRWSDMHGDERRRWCLQCGQHVYRVDALLAVELEALLERARGERVCAQLYRRLDGTVMTKDCPSAWSVGLSQAVERWGAPVGIVGSAAVIVVALFFSLVVVFGDNVRALVGTSGGALAGTGAVKSRPSR